MSPETRDQALIHSSDEPNWRTELALFEKLDAEFNFAIDLAADRTSTLIEGLTEAESGWREDRFFGPGSLLYEDALAGDCVWAEFSSPQFVNPPFSRKLANAYTLGHVNRGGGKIPHPVDPIIARAMRVEEWARKCFNESESGATIVGLFPFAPQTSWFRFYVMGHNGRGAANGWRGHAAMEVRRLPYRVQYRRPDGSPASSAGVNSCVIIWKPNPGYVGPWQPTERYWGYR